MKNKFKTGATDIVLLIISGIFFAGIMLWFGPCAHVREDGSFMNCHWAGVVCAGIAAALTLVSAVHLLVPDRGMKAGLSAGMIPTALLAAAVPNNLISLCMMDTMQCRAVMAPAVTVFSALVTAAAAADVVYQLRRKKK